MTTRTQTILIVGTNDAPLEDSELTADEHHTSVRDNLVIAAQMASDDLDGTVVTVWEVTADDVPPEQLNLQNANRIVNVGDGVSDTADASTIGG